MLWHLPEMRRYICCESKWNKYEFWDSPWPVSMFEELIGRGCVLLCYGPFGNPDHGGPWSHGGRFVTRHALSFVNKFNNSTSYSQRYTLWERLLAFCCISTHFSVFCIKMNVFLELLCQGLSSLLSDSWLDTITSGAPTWSTTVKWLNSTGVLCCQKRAFSLSYNWTAVSVSIVQI